VPPPDPNAPGVVAGARGGSNKDGKSCTPVNYTFAGDGVNTVALKWDTFADSNAVFTYTLNTKLRSITDGSGWANAVRPRVAWLNEDGSSANLLGTPAFVPGLACLGTNPPSNVPGPYGTVVSDDGIATIVINVPASLPLGGVTLPTTPPFPIVIGRERMQVIGVSPGAPLSYTLTLDLTAPGRTKGGTTAGAHSPGDSVMSTPLPIIPTGFNSINPNYQALYVEGKQAQMCVQDYGLGNGGIDASGNPQVYDFATFIDIGDGFGKAGP
jgi:hypothetical protein